MKFSLMLFVGLLAFGSLGGASSWALVDDQYPQELVGAGEGSRYYDWSFISTQDQAARHISKGEFTEAANYYFDYLLRASRAPDEINELPPKIANSQSRCVAAGAGLSMINRDALNRSGSGRYVMQWSGLFDVQDGDYGLSSDTRHRFELPGLIGLYTIENDGCSAGSQSYLQPNLCRWAFFRIKYQLQRAGIMHRDNDVITYARDNFLVEAAAAPRVGFNLFSSKRIFSACSDLDPPDVSWTDALALSVIALLADEHNEAEHWFSVGLNKVDSINRR